MKLSKVRSLDKFLRPQPFNFVIAACIIASARRKLGRGRKGDLETRLFVTPLGRLIAVKHAWGHL